MRIRFNQELLLMMNLFSKITRTQPKDCIDAKDLLYFVVSPGMGGKAIGRGAENIKKLEIKLKRRIRVVEYSIDPTKFVKNLLYPLKADEITMQNKQIIIKASSSKGLIIGRNAKHLNTLKSVVQRYFDIQDIKVM